MRPPALAIFVFVLLCTTAVWAQVHQYALNASHNTADLWTDQLGQCYDGIPMVAHAACNAAGAGWVPSCCVKCTCARNKLNMFINQSYYTSLGRAVAPFYTSREQLLWDATAISKWDSFPKAPGRAILRDEAGYRNISNELDAVVLRATPRQGWGSAWGGGVRSPWFQVDLSKQPVVRIVALGCNRLDMQEWQSEDPAHWWVRKAVPTKWSLKFGMYQREYSWAPYISDACDDSGVFEFKLPQCLHDFTAETPAMHPGSTQMGQLRLFSEDNTSPESKLKECEFQSVSVYYQDDKTTAPQLLSSLLSPASAHGPSFLWMVLVTIIVHYSLLWE